VTDVEIYVGEKSEMWVTRSEPEGCGGCYAMIDPKDLHQFLSLKRSDSRLVLLETCVPSTRSLLWYGGRAFSETGYTSSSYASRHWHLPSR
jgi:hypothetical protein